MGGHMTFRTGKLQVIANRHGVIALYWHTAHRITSVAVVPRLHWGREVVQGSVVGRCDAFSFGPLSFARTDVLRRPVTA